MVLCAVCVVDESGSDSDGAGSSSSYSSLSDFVLDIQSSDIVGETPQDLATRPLVDESCVYTAPKQLVVPDVAVSNSDSALSAADSDDVSSSEDEYNHHRKRRSRDMQEVSVFPVTLSIQSNHGNCHFLCLFAVARFWDRLNNNNLTSRRSHAHSTHPSPLTQPTPRRDESRTRSCFHVRQRPNHADTTRRPATVCVPVS